MDAINNSGYTFRDRAVATNVPLKKNDYTSLLTYIERTIRFSAVVDLAKQAIHRRLYNSTTLSLGPRRLPRPRRSYIQRGIRS
jgi:hypothetical protein